MNLNRRLEPLPELEAGLSEHQEVLLLAVMLTAGLAFVTPVLSLFVGIPVLAVVGLTGAVYGALAVLLRHVVVGLYIAFTVTATFAANVPLADNMYLRTLEGHLGPELWLMQVPLAGIAAYLALTVIDDSYERAPSTTARVFGAFVVWVSLSAILGTATHVDAALFLAWLMSQAVVAFVAVRYAVRTDILSFRMVIETVALAVSAHAMVAIIQFFNRGILGLGPLGESAHFPIASLSLGPLGEFATGTYVAGFTAMSFILASLIILTIPVVLALAVSAPDWRRWVFVGVAVIMTAVLRTTGTDAGRGALAVAVGTFAVMLVVLYGRRLLGGLISSGGLIQRGVPMAFAAFLGIVAFLYPSSDSGSTSTVTDIGSGAGANAGTSGSGAGANAGTGSTEAALQELSIPFFDIGGLGIRLQQYLIGLDLFFQHPLFGIGGANFIYHATEYGLPRPMPLHSVYIALLAETGLPGFLLYTAALALVLSAGWQAVGVKTDTGQCLLLVGVLAGMVGFLVFGVFDILPITKVPALFSFWILAGAVVGTYEQ